MTRFSLVALCAALAACEIGGVRHVDAERRPKLGFDPVTEVRIRPGPLAPGDTFPGPQELAAENAYEGNSYAIQDGYRLYRWMNCVYCHGEGGGTIGPPLWDATWIYGSAPADIAESILRGRPNGMPAFAGKIPESEVWKIVAYVQMLKPGGGLDRAGVK